MNSAKVSRRQLYGMQICLKGAALILMAMLPVLYEKNLLTAHQLGVIGALPAITLITTGLLLPYIYRRENPRFLMFLSIMCGLLVPVFFTLFVYELGPLILCIIAYMLNGLSVAFSSIASNTLQADATTAGKRFSFFAQIGMTSDIVRIIVPLIIAFVFVRTDFRLVGIMHLILTSALLYIVVRLPKSKNVVTEPLNFITLKSDHNLLLKISYEFLDSMASTQLFVFLPIIMLAKGYSLQNSLAFQVALFTGYLLGRPVIAHIANRTTGLRALQVSEMTMAVAVIALLLTQNTIALILIVTLLGMSGRGTSPLIKAMVFDASTRHAKQSISALHMAIGDGGNAFAQLSFGALLALYGSKAPFIGSATIIVIILVITVFDHKRGQKLTPQ